MDFTIIRHKVSEYSFKLLFEEAPIDSVNTELLITEVEPYVGNETALKFYYTDKVSYGSAGALELKGELIVDLKDKELKSKLLSDWRSNKDLDLNALTPILQTLYFLVTPFVTSLSTLMGFPYPLLPPVPHSEVKREETS